jgi:hypothetical protein
LASTTRRQRVGTCRRGLGVVVIVIIVVIRSSHAVGRSRINSVVVGVKRRRGRGGPRGGFVHGQGLGSEERDFTMDGDTLLLLSLKSWWHVRQGEGGSA